jgi:CBS domain-containing protein
MIMILQSKLLAGEISSHKLTHVDREASVLDASKLMRKSGATELLVTGEADGVLSPLGIVTASDIVTRVIAAELDPAVLTTGDIAWPGLAATDAPERFPERRRGAAQTNCEALAVMDGEGRLVGTVRLDEFLGTRVHPSARFGGRPEDRLPPPGNAEI